jgi:hypothetical protein
MQQAEDEKLSGKNANARKADDEPSDNTKHGFRPLTGSRGTIRAKQVFCEQALTFRAELTNALEPINAYEIK